MFFNASQTGSPALNYISQRYHSCQAFGCGQNSKGLQPTDLMGCARLSSKSANSSKFTQIISADHPIDNDQYTANCSIYTRVLKKSKRHQYIYFFILWLKQNLCDSILLIYNTQEQKFCTIVCIVTTGQFLEVNSYLY